MNEKTPNPETNRLASEHLTGEDRVRMVARQLTEPRTVNWIANEADYSNEPTKRVLERLVDDGILRMDTRGPHTTYYPDYRHQAIQEAVRLHDSDLSVDDVTAKINEMNARIRELKAEFDVESANELRATLAAGQLTTDEAERRRELAREWDHLRRRVRVAGFAVREWDFLEPPVGPTEARS